MAEFPALPFFTDAYLADTRHLTAEEHGAYLLLLMCAWRTRGCHLKDDDRTLARIVGVSPTRWRRLRPVLAEFFTVADGHWRQKKLSAVYAGVEERVAKNRANGAKGGRAKAAKLAAERRQGPVTNDGPKDPCGDRLGDGAGQTGSVAAGDSLPTKAIVQIPEPKAAEEAGAPGEGPTGADPAWCAAVAAAAGFPEQGISGDSLTFSPVALWQAAGADLMADVLPVITRLSGRLRRKGTPAPRHLNYYTSAILEARDSRLGALKAGAKHAADHPAPPPKRRFDKASADDWRLFLGNAENRFRGDYLSANWRIGPDHPHFLPASLGPDPRERHNPHIPAAVFAAYAATFRWRQR